MRFAAFLVSAMFVLGAAATAHGYVRTRSEDDKYDLIWARPDITLTVRTGAMAMMESNIDLQAALTHELGHVLGLAHPCYLGGTPNPPQVDNLGNPVMACSSTLPSSILNATMYPSATPGEIQERLLSDDELLALHDLYPAGRAPVVEGPRSSGSGGCAVGGAAVGGTPSAAIFIAVVLLGRRRRRRA